VHRATASRHCGPSSRRRCIPRCGPSSRRRCIPRSDHSRRRDYIPRCGPSSLLRRSIPRWRPAFLLRRSPARPRCGPSGRSPWRRRTVGATEGTWGTEGRWGTDGVNGGRGTVRGCRCYLYIHDGPAHLDILLSARLQEVCSGRLLHPLVPHRRTRRARPCLKVKACAPSRTPNY
jgi:hypothetical protein